MICAECMEGVLVAELRRNSEAESEIASHLSGCPQCAQAVTLLRAGEETLAERLSLAAVPRQAAEVVAQHAVRRVARERFVRWRMLPLIVLGFIVGLTLLVTTSGPRLARFLRPPPTVDTQTFSLTCLSGEQAAALLQPYLPRPENPLWQAEAFDVRAAGGGIRAVTVRAPKTTLIAVPGLLARFERDPHAACRIGGSETH